MADPVQRPASAPDDGTVDRDVRIEQLLLSGLDHYFRGQFERAIDVWTRVLFLDRDHARARAYIERARAAVAERLRESEALLQAGVEACDRGEVVEARALLNSAIEHGGAHDTAFSVLERVDRLESVASDEPPRPARRRAGARRARRGAVAGRAAARRVPWLRWAVVVLVCVGASVAVFRAGVWARLAPIGLDDRPAAAAGPARVVPERLPAPTVPELALQRAEALAAGGRHAEALAVLEAVGFGAGLGAAVDRLRADLQRAVLEGDPAASAKGTPGAAGAAGRRP